MSRRTRSPGRATSRPPPARPSPTSPDGSEGTVGVVVPVARRSDVNAWLASWPERAADAPGARAAIDSSVTPSGDDRIVVLTGLDTKGLEFDAIVVVRPQEIEAESATGTRHPLRRLHPRHPAPHRHLLTASRRRSPSNFAESAQVARSAESAPSSCRLRRSAPTRWSDGDLATRWSGRGDSRRRWSGRGDLRRLAEVGFRACRRGRPECTRSHRGAAGARGVGDHPQVDAGGGPRHGRAGRGHPAGRRVADRRPARARRPGGRPHRRPAAGDPVPPGASSAASRPTTTARRSSSSTSRASASSPSPRWSTRSTTARSSSPTAAASRPTTTTTPSSSRPSSPTRSARARAPTWSIGRHYRATVADWGADKALDGLPPAARARARRLLDLRLLHRRPLPHRRQPRAARHRPRRRRADEPDQRHLPHPRATRRPQAPPPRLPGRREGDLRALHGGRRRAQDDVRHLHRGRPGARPVPQADEPPGAHRVPPRRSHHPRPARGPARHHVRRHGHRLARSRTPAG